MRAFNMNEKDKEQLQAMKDQMTAADAAGVMAESEYLEEQDAKHDVVQCHCEEHGGRCDNDAKEGNAGFCDPCLFGCLP